MKSMHDSYMEIKVSDESMLTTKIVTRSRLYDTSKTDKVDCYRNYLLQTIDDRSDAILYDTDVGFQC